MLLSTDWFLPYWSIIELEAERKLDFQGGCREIVRHFLGDAMNYYLINFSEERVAATRKSVRELSKKCGFTEAAKSKLEHLIEHRSDRDQFQKTAWLFRIVKPRLLEDTTLEPTIKFVLLRSGNSISDDPIDFGRLCSQSESAWDGFVRKLTPELPESLADLVSVGLIPSAELTATLRQLTPSQRELLGSKFISAAKDFTGSDFDQYWPVADI